MEWVEWIDREGPIRAAVTGSPFPPVETYYDSNSVSYNEDNTRSTSWNRQTSGSSVGSTNQLVRDGRKIVHVQEPPDKRAADQRAVHTWKISLILIASVAFLTCVVITLLLVYVAFREEEDLEKIEGYKDNSGQIS